MKANVVEYELKNGEFITMTIQMIRLYKLKKENKKAYENVSKNMVNGPDKKDVLEVAQFLHGAYLCANQEETDTISFEKFLEEFNEDWKYNTEILDRLINPKKYQTSETPS